MPADRYPLLSGLTLRSFAVALFMMMATALIVQVAGVSDDWYRLGATEALPVPVMAVFVALTLASGGLFLLTRLRLMSRAEGLCALYMALLAAPLMGHGFWRPFLSINQTLVRSGNHLDASVLGSKFWPEGENLLAGAFSSDSPWERELFGVVSWLEDAADGSRAAVIEHASPEDVSEIRLRLPLVSEEAPGVYLDLPYLIRFHAHADDLGGSAAYYVQFYYDDEREPAAEPILAREEANVTPNRPEGFHVSGAFGVRLPPEIERGITVVFGFRGEGRVVLSKPVMADISALELARNGRRIVTEAEFAALPPYLRGGLTVRPDNLLSLAGVRYMLAGGYPGALWLTPILAWGLPLILLLFATLGMAVLVRRQWIQSERFPLPLAQFPLYLLGGEEKRTRALPDVFYQAPFWLGFGVVMLWTLLRIGHAMNPAIPDVSVSIPLKSYFADAGWGKTWDEVNFSLSALIFGLALFVELNVLFSIVLGYILFRLQHWLGEGFGWSADGNYPYGGQQKGGAWLGYALMVLIFMRKELWRLLSALWKGGGAGEAMSYRMAWGVLLLSAVGLVLWAQWVGFDTLQVMIMGAAILLGALVAARLRAECGLPGSRFSAGAFLVLVPIMGGFAFFDPNLVLFLSFIGIILGGYGFMMLPGMQLEFLELGRRIRVKRSHLVATVVLGIAGGLFIGGWSYFNGLYASGADTYKITGEFNNKTGELKVYNQEMSVSRLEAATGEAPSRLSDPRTWAFGVGALGAVVLSILRQLFAGFWFHPVGWLLGPSQLAIEVWGSVLLAGVVRFIVLRMGGAVTVREKLMPAAVGVLVATVLAYLLLYFINAWIFYFHEGASRFGGNL